MLQVASFGGGCCAQLHTTQIKWMSGLSRSSCSLRHATPTPPSPVPLPLSLSVSRPPIKIARLCYMAWQMPAPKVEALRSSLPLTATIFLPLPQPADFDSLMPLCWQTLFWHSGIAYLPSHPPHTAHLGAGFAVRHFSFYLMSAPIMLCIYFVSFYLSWPVISRINSNAARLEVSHGLWTGTGGVSFLFILAALLAFALPSAHKTLQKGYKWSPIGMGCI